jgi:DNA mismatch endonuclease (patch repair protein)
MTDSVDQATRSRTMASIRSTDTRPEVALRKALFAAGVRGWRCHRKDLPGKPDIAFGRARVAVFVDGAFWHGHPSKYWIGRSGPYWDAKIVHNMERDRRVTADLEARGWTVVRIWDFEIERSLAQSVEIIRRAISPKA